jgi:hypothetical protein
VGGLDALLDEVGLESIIKVSGAPATTCVAQLTDQISGGLEKTVEAVGSMKLLLEAAGKWGVTLQ